MPPCGKVYQYKGVFIMNKLSKLIDVKSIVTLALTVVIMVLALKGTVDIKDIYLVIIAFYFGTQSKKGSGSND